MSTFFAAVVVSCFTAILVELVTDFPLLFSVGIGFLTGAAVAIILIARSRGEAPRAVAEEVVATARAVVTEPDTTFRERAANEQLYRTSELLLLSGKAPEAVPVLKELTEVLRVATNRALQFAEKSETTFNLTKLATEDLPLAVKLFLELGESDRLTKQGAFTRQLTELTSKVKELVSIIDSGQADTFNAQSTFINMKFN